MFEGITGTNYDFTSCHSSKNKHVLVPCEWVMRLDIKILDTESSADLASELGPLKYLSELTDKPMNSIINILLLIIIFAVL